MSNENATLLENNKELTYILRNYRLKNVLHKNKFLKF